MLDVNITIENLTDDIRLINCFYSSGCNSLNEFINNGKDWRLKIKSYGLSSEAKLNRALKRFDLDLDSIQLPTTNEIEKPTLSKTIFNDYNLLNESAISLLKNSPANSLQTSIKILQIYSNNNFTSWWAFITNATPAWQRKVGISKNAEMKLSSLLYDFICKNIQNPFIKYENIEFCETLSDFFVYETNIEFTKWDKVQLISNFINFNFKFYATKLKISTNSTNLNKEEFLQLVDKPIEIELNIFAKAYSVLGDLLFSPLIANIYLPSWVLGFRINEYIIEKRILSSSEAHNFTLIEELFNYNQEQRLALKNWGQNTEKEFINFITAMSMIEPLFYNGKLNRSLETAIKSKDLCSHFLIFLNNLKPLLKLTGINRILNDLTLEETGLKVDLTRERIRQIEIGITNCLNKLNYWWHLFYYQLIELTNSSTTSIPIKEIETLLGWHNDSKSENLNLLKWLIRNKFDTIKVLEVNKIEYISLIDTNEWLEKKAEILNVLDSAIQEKLSFEYVEAFTYAAIRPISLNGLKQLFKNEIFQELKFTNSGNDSTLLSIGKSNRSKIRSILRNSEKPLNFDEIKAIYEKEYGETIDERPLQSCLHTGEEFFCYNRSTYGLLKHLTFKDDEIDFITNFCLTEVIKKQPNKQWHSDEILKAIAPLNLPKFNKYVLDIMLGTDNELIYRGAHSWILAENTNADDNRLLTNDLIFKTLLAEGKALKVYELEMLIKTEKGVGNFFQGTLRPNKKFSKVSPNTWGLIERDFVLNKFEWQEQLDHLIEVLKTKNSKIHFSEIKDHILEKFKTKINENLIWGFLLQEPNFKIHRGKLLEYKMQTITNGATT